MPMPNEKKKFDPGAFLDNYEDNVSASIRKPKSKQNPVDETLSSPVEAETLSQQEAPSTSSLPKNSKQRGAIVKNLGEPEFTDAESEFMMDYLIERVPMRFSKTGKQVAVSHEYHKKIMKILAILGDNLTFGGYVDNVLRKHFEECDPIIRSIINKVKIV